MITDSSLRDGAGRFLPGRSGNPGGASKGYVKLGTRLQRRLHNRRQQAKALALYIGQFAHGAAFARIGDQGFRRLPCRP